MQRKVRLAGGITAVNPRALALADAREELGAKCQFVDERELVAMESELSENHLARANLIARLKASDGAALLVTLPAEGAIEFVRALHVRPSGATRVPLYRVTRNTFVLVRRT